MLPFYLFFLSKLIVPTYNYHYDLGKSVRQATHGDRENVLNASKDSYANLLKVSSHSITRITKAPEKQTIFELLLKFDA